jgi:hypothetical protein
MVMIPLASDDFPMSPFVDSEYSPAKRLTPITTTLFDAAIEEKFERLVNIIFCTDNSCSFVCCVEVKYLSQI